MVSPNSGLLHDCQHLVKFRLQLYCPGIIDTHISGLWTRRGQGRSAAAVQSQTVQWHWRLFPHLGCTSQSALWRTGRLLVQILPLFNFHFLKFLAIFLPFDSAVLFRKSEEIRSWSCFQMPKTVTSTGARRKTHHISGTNLHLLQSPADMTWTDTGAIKKMI